MSGRTIMRNDWSRAPACGVGKTRLRLGCAEALPVGYGPCAEAVQLVTQWFAPEPPESGAQAMASRASRVGKRRNITQFY